MAKKQPPSSDPLHSILGAIFKGIWWLVSYPFKDKQTEVKRQEFRQQLRFQLSLVERQAAGDLRGAIMQADILLDKALQAANFSGVNVGERLKSAAGHLQRDVLDAAWSAHKVRNRLAHELQYNLSSSEGAPAMRDFRKIIDALLKDKI